MHAHGEATRQIRERHFGKRAPSADEEHAKVYP